MDHVAFAVPDLIPVRDLLLDVFGGTVYAQTFGGRSGGFQGTQMDLGGTGLEVIDPAGPDSFLHPFLNSRGPGLHHINWLVRDLDGFVEELRSRGVRLTGIERGPKDEITTAFIHPASGFGVLTQMRPATYELREDSPSRRDLPPPRLSRGKIDYVAILTEDSGPAIEFYTWLLEGTMGEPWRQGGAIGRVMRGPEIGLCFLQPDSPESPLNRLLRKRGPGMHHLAIKVNDMEEVLAAARNAGLPLLPGDTPSDAYIHPSNPTGALLRLMPPD